MATHTCEAIVVSCIDFRFQKYIRDWLDKNFIGKQYDYVAFAGASKELPIILGQIALSVKLHHIKQVVLMHHENCGAYGQDSTPERHATDLRKARREILKRYPTLRLDLYYLHLDGTVEKVE